MSYTLVNASVTFIFAYCLAAATVVDSRHAIITLMPLLLHECMPPALMLLRCCYAMLLMLFFATPRHAASADTPRRQR